jgi:hypothetical protein
MDTEIEWGYPQKGKQFIISAAKYKRTFIEVRIYGSPMLLGYLPLSNRCLACPQAWGD